MRLRLRLPPPHRLPYFVSGWTACDALIAASAGESIAPLLIAAAVVLWHIARRIERAVLSANDTATLMAAALMGAVTFTDSSMQEKIDAIRRAKT